MPTPNRLAPANTPRLDQLVVAIAKLAQQYQVPAIVIVGVDPTTQQARLYGSEEAKQLTRGVVMDKYGLHDSGETEWPG